MENRIILCSNCGAKNRLAESTGVPRCGKCSKILAIGRHKYRFTRKQRIGFLIISAAGFCIFCGIYASNKNDASSQALAPPQSSALTQNEIANALQDQATVNALASKNSDTEPQKVDFNEPPADIQPGVFLQSYAEGVAPLSIITSTGANYFIKVVNRSTNQSILEAYLIGGMPFKTEIPLGTYEIRYATGTTWYGLPYLFGPKTHYAKTDQDLNFFVSDDSYVGHTIELILQENGNLSASSIGASDF